MHHNNEMRASVRRRESPGAAKTSLVLNRERQSPDWRLESAIQENGVPGKKSPPGSTAEQNGKIILLDPVNP
jgi:hypothetical protein